MGADLILAIQAKRSDWPLNFDAGRQLVPQLVEDDFTDYFKEQILNCDYDPGVIDETGNYKLIFDLNEAKQRVLEAIDETEKLWQDCYRNVNIWHNILGGYDLLLTGDTTWGDTPEGYDDAVAIYEVPRIRRRIGFVDIGTGER